MDQSSPDQWPSSVFAGSKPFCDIVMKGGVASGVVYPFTICRVAKDYVIRSIGGTSVGAIAATLAAAAEFRRRGPLGTGDGYTQLAQLPAFLAVPGNLRSLFTADEQTQPYLDAALTFVAVDETNKPIGLPQKISRILWIALGPSLLKLLLIAVVAIAANPLTYILAFRSAAFSGWINGLCAVFELVVVTLALISAGMFFLGTWLQRCVSVTGARDFGWAHGHRTSSAPAGLTPPLTDWLYARIQTAAGLPPAEPLTIAHLENCGLPANQDPIEGDTNLGVTLRVVTTCLTLNRPFTLPFNPQTKTTFWFTLADFERFFPREVMTYLDNDAVCPAHPGAPLYRKFPADDKLPVVVAARMSMSFPILFTAVKLYAEDPDGQMQPMWFSDGGLTSNMPIHFFDMPIPRWPTFAIDLLGSDPQHRRHGDEDQYKLSEGDVFIEGDVDEDVIEPWDRLGQSVLQFAGAIIETTRTWQDRLLGHTPGYADRTVGIRLAPDEGGLNVAMPPQVVMRLTKRGDCAGKQLVERFDDGQEGWPSQRWTRYRNIMDELSGWLARFGYSYFWRDTRSNDYPSFICTATAPFPHSSAAPWASAEAACRGQEDTDRVPRLRREWETDFERGAAEPVPDMVSRREF